MPLFCNIYIITSLFFVFENKRHYTEKHLIANLKVTKTECTKCTKLKVTKNIFNLQEWLQNMQNCKSLFQQIFIVYKTFTVRIKTKNLPRMTRFGLWSFHKGVS